MAKRIMTVTIAGDLHADLVAERIAAEGEPMFRLNIDEFPEQFAVALELADGRWGGTLANTTTGDSLAITDIGAVWMRKKADFSFVSKQLAAQERAYAQAEAEHLLFSLLYSLDCYWMSHPLALRGAIWKGEQLKRAARLGFLVPPSLATNGRASVEAFMAAQGEIIFKALSSSTLAAEEVAPEERLGRGLATTRITAEHEGLLDSVAELPCFFQRNIAKRHELRVTVIGDKVFAAAIHSQDDERTAIDCRDMSAEIRYEKADLPAEIERRCREFVHSYGLTFGAIDLIVTPDGDHVFLENNPAGQFLFVQQLVPELDMLGAVADCLRAGAGAGAGA